MKIVTVLILSFISSICFAGLESEAGQIADNLAALIIKSKKLLDQCQDYNQLPKAKKRSRALQNTYEVLKKEKMVPLMRGLAGSVEPDLSKIVSFANQHQTIGFHKETVEILEIADEYEQSIEKIRELHQKYTLTCKLWVCLNHYSSHPGYELRIAAIVNPTTREYPPTQELELFIDLLQQTLLCVLTYSSFCSETISKSLQIKTNISSHYCFSCFCA